MLFSGVETGHERARQIIFRFFLTAIRRIRLAALLITNSIAAKDLQTRFRKIPAKSA